MPKKKENLSPEERLKKAVIPKEEEPYKLPDNWVWTRLEEIISILGDGIHGTPVYDENGEYYFINGNNLNNGKIIIKENTKKVNEIEYLKYKKDLTDRTIFISINGTLGNLAFYNNEKIILGKSACYFNLLDNIYKKFIYHLLKTDYFIKYAIKSSTGSTIKNLSLKAMKNTQIPLPPLEEQKRIVEKLDSLFEKTGRIKEIIEEVKEKTALRREAVLSKAFTGELTEKWRAENKTENAKELLLKINEEKLKNNPKAKIKDISEMLVNEDEVPYKIPENWIWTRLGDIFRVERGGSPRPIKDFLVDDIDGINWIKIGDTELGKKYINSTKEKIKEEGIKKSRYVKKGDLLLTNSMSFGRAYILNCDGCIHDGWLVLQPEFDKISREYFYYLLNSRYMYLVFSELAKGSTVKNLNKDIVKTVAISLPPLDEQKEIVRILDKVFEEENKISELISLEEKVEILEKTILDKAFRGELGTGDISDEPAIELLKRALEENE